MKLDNHITPPKKEASIKLQNMLEEVNQTFGHAKEVIMAAYTQALVEGFNPTEAKNLLLSSVKTLSPRTIYYYLPNESKDNKMQQLALKKKSLQNCNDKKTSNNKDLLDSNHTGYIKKSNVDSFMEYLTKELDSRKVTKEMYLLPASLENNKSDDTLQSISQENNEHGKKSAILLPEKFADYISDKTQTNRTIGKPSRFRLEHDGNRVTAVRDFSII